MSLVMGLVNLVSIPAESDDIVTQVDGSHFSRLAWPTMQPSPQHAHNVICSSGDLKRKMAQWECAGHVEKHNKQDGSTTVPRRFQTVP